MDGIRYKQRICEDPEQINEFLKCARTGILGIQGEEYPYCVPVNYVWSGGNIYFHGMGSGRKNELLAMNPRISFTVYEEYGTVKDPMPCHADTSYMSVMLFGTVKKMEDFTACGEVLTAIVEKFMPGFYKGSVTGALVEQYRSSFDQNRVAVYELIPDVVTAKENVAKPDEIF